MRKKLKQYILIDKIALQTLDTYILVLKYVDIKFKKKGRNISSSCHASLIFILKLDINSGKKQN